MTRLFPVLLATLLTTSVVVAGATFASSTTQASPTELDSCTTITEPGHYVLTEDITANQSSCIQIRASNVVLDGAGHTLDGNGETYRKAVDVSSSTELTNVSVTDLTVTSWRNEGVSYTRVDGGGISNLSVSEIDTGIKLLNASNITVNNASFTDTMFSGISLEGANNTTLAQNSFKSGMFGIAAISLAESNGNTLSNNTGSDVTQFIELEQSDWNSLTENRFSGHGDGFALRSSDYNLVARNVITSTGGIQVDSGIGVGGSNNTITENTVSRVESGISVSGSNNTISENEISIAVSFGMSISGMNQTVVNNTITGGGEGVSGDGGGLALSGTNHSVRSNTIAGNVNGVQVESTSGTIRIEENRIVNNRYGIHVLETKVCAVGPEGAESLAVHRNVIASNIPDSYGILNEDSAVVNATQNYWGAEDGPGSPVDEADSPLEDPVTGTLADGSGNVVSEGAPGVSNVHFDSWLRQPINQTTTAT